MDFEEKFRKKMKEGERKRLQKRREKSKDKGLQWDTTTVPVKIEVCECEVQTDTVPDMIPLLRCTYADVATEAPVEVMGSKYPKEPSGIKAKDSVPASRVGTKCGGDSRVCMAPAVVVHGVSCEQSMWDIIAAARSMKFGNSQRLLGPVGWLVWKEGYGRRLAR